ncbi:MAG: outer membrane lipoprotein carrier protein LolA [Phycisphaerales bacterium JB060]
MRTDVLSMLLTAGFVIAGPIAGAHQSGAGSSVAIAQEERAGGAEDYETAEEVLAALEDADADLETFTSGIIYTTITDLGGALTRRTGEIAFAQKPSETGPTNRRFAVRFDTLLAGERYFEDERALQTIAFDGRYLTEMLHSEEQINRREIVAEGQQVDPFELGDGPFPPLPIGQQKEDILRRYDVRLVPATESLEPGEELDPEDPFDRTEIRMAENLMRFAEGSVQLLLVPRRASADTKFSEIRLWYKAGEDGRLLPRMSRTVDASSNDVSIVQLMHPLKVNDPPREDLLTITAPEGWTVNETRLRSPSGGRDRP